MSSVLAAVGHYLALGLGFGAVYSRGWHLRQHRLKEALRADNIWGIAALFWIVSGLLRAFAGLEKGSAYYLGNGFFQLKMLLFALIFVLELWPMIRLIQVRLSKDRALPELQMQRFAVISFVQLLLLVLMIVCASAMARGHRLW